MLFVLQEAFPARFKCAHLIKQPWYVSIVLSIVRPFLKQKTKDRVSRPLSGITDRVSRPLSGITDRVSRPLSGITDRVSRPLSITDRVSRPLSGITDWVSRPLRWYYRPGE